MGEPNAERTDGPFATLGKARQAVREALAAPSRGVTVWIAAGTYRLDSSWRLDKADSGRPGRPVRWRALPGASVRITGDKPLSSFAPLDDPAVLLRLASGARAHVLAADLKAQGLSDFGTIEPRGSPGLELFFRRERMPLAAYPDDGWLRIADVPQAGPKRFHEGLAREKRFDGVPVGRHYGRIAYEGDRPSGWSDAGEIYIHGYWTWDWNDSVQRVASIDRRRREITLAEPHHGYGYTKNQRFRFLNVLEELDRPGEWILDRAAGKIYFWPPEAPGAGDVTVSMLAEPLLSVEGASDVSIEGLALAESRGPGAVLRGASRVRLAGCELVNLGGDAVVIEGGEADEVRSCDIHDLALGGIRLVGGDRKTLVPAGHSAVNNDIYRFSRWIRTYQYAVRLEGVGAVAAHNRIHDAPHEAISLSGNDHVIEYNEIFDVCRETGDSGAFHTGRDWTWRGNILRYNYIHDLKGPGLHGVMGIYLDDWGSGFTILGNLLVRAGRSIMIGGGRDNLVENNVVIEGSPAIHVDARGLGWAKYYFDGTTPTLFKTYREMRAGEPPYSDRYPALKTLLDDEPALPKYNKILRNISWGGRWLDVYDANVFDLGMVEFRDNIVADADLLRRLKPGFKGWDPYYLNIDTRAGYDLFRRGEAAIEREFAGNVFLAAPPAAFDPVRRALVFPPDSPAIKSGFRPLPLDRMGLVVDEFRKSKS
ncbi:MAG: right-handed parallel beta-helix repeat-containing protein [Acidobacteriota bacterium]|nr:right-handed parallel beta-helix repeat-containing protein [Acidobacteriota bacterium]